MVWFRVIDVALKGTAFTFGSVLGLYLLGLATGAFAWRARERDQRSALATFAVAQLFVTAWAIAALLFLAWAPADWPGIGGLLARMLSYRGRLGPEADTATFAAFLVVPSFLFLPATIAMGLSYGALQTAVQVDARGASLRVGRLSAANIAGSLLGSLLTGLVVLEVSGTAGALRVLLGLSAGGALIGAIKASRPGIAAAALALGAALLGLIPANEELWRRLHGRARGASIFEEDSAAVVGLVRNRFDGYRVLVNGAGHSELPYGGTHTLLGALAVALHPRPEDVAVIGLGSGNTAWAALARPEVKRAVVFEIAPAQGPALRRLGERGEFVELRALFDDPRVSFRFDDGRRGLRISGEKLDVIEIDALYPWAAWSGNIYSTEFFALCRDRLKRGGLFVSWAPTDRIRRSIASAFPFVRAYSGDFVVASSDPVPEGAPPGVYDSLAARLGSATVEDLHRMIRESKTVARTPGEVNRDLHPRDEFQGPGGSERSSR
jgi:spermidine synthase